MTYKEVQPLCCNVLGTYILMDEMLMCFLNVLSYPVQRHLDASLTLLWEMGVVVEWIRVRVRGSGGDNYETQ